MKFFNDFNEKWYFWGTAVGIMAGITLGWLMFYNAPEDTVVVIDEPCIDTITTEAKDWSKDTNLTEGKKIYYDYLYDKKNSRTCDEKIYAD